jgi:putative spermidine/putrescine transport system permease protein
MATTDVSAPPASGRPPEGPVRRLSTALFRHPRLRLAATLGGPIAWMALVYLVSLVLLLANSFWRLNPLTSQVVQEFTLKNYKTVFINEATRSTYYEITLRTVVMAVLVTLADVAIAFPFAYYAIRIARPKVRTRLLLAVTIPLWANYLIKVFAWKTLLEGGGPIHDLLQIFHIDLTGSNMAVWMTFTYIWFPYAVLPIAAALERVPTSYLEASGDLGARAWTTFRRVVVPLAIPGVVAGSIFTFSLTLGDYLTPILVGKNYFIGNTIAQLTGVLNNKPLAATIAVIPIVIVAIYLTIARMFGAFEAL